MLSEVPFRDQAFFAWLDVVRTYAAVSRQLERELRPLGLTLAFCEVLVRLGQAGDHRLSMTELGERVFLTRSGVTQLVDRMQRAGLLVRVPDPASQRTTRVVMTPAGHAALAMVSPVFARSVREHFSRHLTADQVAVIRAGLGAVTAALGEPAESQVDPISGRQADA